jgi:hypothetical protein
MYIKRLKQQYNYAIKCSFNDVLALFEYLHLKCSIAAGEKDECHKSNISCYGYPNYHHYCLNHASNPLVNQVLIKLKKILFIFNSNLQSKSRKFLV